MIRPQKLVITSNYHPKDIWADETTLEPILRRFKIVHFKRLITTTEYESDSEETRPGYVPVPATANPDVPTPVTQSEPDPLLDMPW